MNTASTTIIVGVATPSSLPSVLQLLEETWCLFFFIDLKSTRSYNLLFKQIYEQVDIFYMQSKYIQSNTKIVFAFILKSIIKRDVSSTNFIYSTGSLLSEGHRVYWIWDLLIIQHNFDIFMLLSNNTFLTDFSRQFLHCGAVWTLKFTERDIYHTPKRPLRCSFVRWGCS